MPNWLLIYKFNIKIRLKFGTTKTCRSCLLSVSVNSSNAYMPPAMRRQPKESVSKPKYRDAYEPASNMKKEEIAPGKSEMIV